ncbi:MAG: OsmC family protein [Candidatus Bathyarchaeota archaeon]|nr:OsmC family protein [Candidatus Termiticorpusculum sp.]
MTDTTKVFVDWKGNLQPQAHNEKGVTTDFEIPKEHGDNKTALSPMENLLSSLAACSNIHILIILKKKQLDIESYSVEATSKETYQHKRSRTQTVISRKVRLSGRDIKKTCL